jgi:hypothetical protein
MQTGKNSFGCRLVSAQCVTLAVSLNKAAPIASLNKNETKSAGMKIDKDLRPLKKAGKSLKMLLLDS